MHIRKGVVCSHLARDKMGSETVFVDWFFAYHRILYSLSRYRTSQFVNMGMDFTKFDVEKIPFQERKIRFYGGDWENYLRERRLPNGKMILEWKHKCDMVVVNPKGCW
jgi:hypothetical protein